MGEWKGDPTVGVGSSVAIFASDEEARQILAILQDVGRPCARASFDELLEGIGSGAIATAIVAEEMIPAIVRPELQKAIAEQPSWSDFPFIVITDRVSLARLYDRIRVLDHVAIVERPLHPPILRNEVHAALRNRMRQREAEAHLLQRAIAEEHLRQMAATLEARISERTADLEQANTRLVREIEERTAAEAHRRDSEEMYRYTLELSQQIAWTADPKGDMITVSPRFGEITGIEMTGNLTERWMSAVHPDDMPTLDERWGRALRTHCPYSADYRLRLADGSYRRYNTTAMPRLAEDGSVIRWYGYTLDVEAQRTAEERLRESEDLYRYTVELSQQIVFTCDADGAFQTVSQRFFTVTGLRGRSTPHDALHPDDRERVLAAWQRCFSSGTPLAIEFRMRTVDGDYCHYRARAAPRRDSRGRIVRWYGTMENIHEQKQADLARIAAEERYRLAAQATDDVIWDIDIPAKVISWSDSAVAIFGCPQDGVTPATWWEQNIHPEDRDRTVAGIAAAKAGTATRWTAEYRFKKADGSYADIFDRGFIIRDAEGKPLRAVGAMADMTERRRAEDELRRMQAELIHVSRLSAMGAMASTLAHEINQPLTAVTSYLRGTRRLLADDNPPMDHVREAIQSAEAGALRAGQIVRRLRELVARGNVSVTREELPRLVEDACVLGLVDAHLLGVSHHIDLDPDARWVEADRIQIEQVLINLIRNAIQAMKDQPVREIRISTRALPDGFVEISVEDTGTGLSDEVMELLFSPFRSTKVEGMGIGLSICRTIVEAHRGKIWAENREGGGAAFRFTLPAPGQRQEEETAGPAE